MGRPGQELHHTGGLVWPRSKGKMQADMGPGDVGEGNSTGGCMRARVGGLNVLLSATVTARGSDTTWFSA